MESHKGKQRQRKHWQNEVTSSKKKRAQRNAYHKHTALKALSLRRIQTIIQTFLFIQPFDVFQVSQLDFFSFYFFPFCSMSKKARYTDHVELYSLAIYVKSMKQAICVIKHVKSVCHWGASAGGKLWVKYFRLNFAVCGNCWWNIQLVLWLWNVSEHYYWQFNFPHQ